MLFQVMSFRTYLYQKKRINISHPRAVLMWSDKKAYAKLKNANLKPIVQLFPDKLVRHIESFLKLK